MLRFHACRNGSPLIVSSRDARRSQTLEDAFSRGKSKSGCMDRKPHARSLSDVWFTQLDSCRPLCRDTAILRRRAGAWRTRLPASLVYMRELHLHAFIQCDPKRRIETRASPKCLLITKRIHTRPPGLPVALVQSLLVLRLKSNRHRLVPPEHFIKLNISAAQ
jgi:hypothetical protein